MTTTTPPTGTDQEREVSANQPTAGLEVLIIQPEAATNTPASLPKQLDYLWNVSPSGAVLIAAEFVPRGQLAPTNRAAPESPTGVTLEIDAWPLEIDFGPIPVDADYATLSYLAHLPGQAVGAVIEVLKGWVTDGSHCVAEVDVSTFADPEDTDWLEAVFTLSIDGGPTDAVRLWEDLAKTLDQATAQMDAASKDILNNNLAFHVVPKDEEWLG